ncbi:MAG: MBL fold metallo-hydrolase [Gemmatimonadales bacterium]|nr:MAG: MBL fold metallo-hydrolase [Gemmatimonadales bacterium]
MNAPIRSSAPTDPTSLRARCWGTRGSIPSPGPETAVFGGNTSCLEVRTADGRCFVFDAGTGIRALGDRMAHDPGSGDVDLFLSHFHWDHIQGLPFFAPLYAAENTVRIHAARQGDVDVETLLRAQMGPVYFPVPYDSLEARMTFEPLTGSAWRHDGVEVAWYRTRHPADTYGFRIRSGGVSVAYFPDNELEGGRYEVDGPGWRSGLEAFLEGVDLLFHDATFTDEEYPSRTGWGHSTFVQAIELAERASVKRLAFFHHAPSRTDGELAGIVAEMRGELARRGSELEVEAATEGRELEIRGG